MKTITQRNAAILTDYNDNMNDLRQISTDCNRSDFDRNRALSEMELMDVRRRYSCMEAAVTNSSNALLEL